MTQRTVQLVLFMEVDRNAEAIIHNVKCMKKRGEAKKYSKKMYR